MNKTLVGLVLIALLVGLGGGYVLGYAIYQPQLQNLQNDLKNMGDDLDDLSNRLDNLHDRYDWVDVTLRNTQSTVTTLNTWHYTVDSSLADAQSSLAALQIEVPNLWYLMVSLNSTVEGIENRSWHSVWSSSGSANVTSGYFQLKGKMFQIGWGYNALYADCWIEITLRFQNGTICWFNGSSGIFGAYDSEGPVEETGQYYVSIRVSNYVNWMVLIYDFY